MWGCFEVVFEALNLPINTALTETLESQGSEVFVLIMSYSST
jgi:hypothetical protein